MWTYMNSFPNFMVTHIAATIFKGEPFENICWCQANKIKLYIHTYILYEVYPWLSGRKQSPHKAILELRHRRFKPGWIPVHNFEFVPTHIYNIYVWVDVRVAVWHETKTFDTAFLFSLAYIVRRKFFSQRKLRNAIYMKRILAHKLVEHSNLSALLPLRIFLCASLLKI